MSRPALVRIEEKAVGAQARVVITLAWEEQQYFGEASGAPDATARPRLLGEATLRALEALSAKRLPLRLDAIAATNLDDSRVAIAQVVVGDGAPLVGSALVARDDPASAPVRAVLDAVNRRLGF